MRRISREEEVERLVLGGSVLGGGGGGSAEEGLALGKLALELGGVVIANPGELGKDAIVATVSTVGSQAAGRGVLKPFNYIEAVRLLEREVPGLKGLVSSENGGLNSVAAWVQAAALGLPVVDAPCDGRAHPTAAMGSMGLHRLPGYVSVQAFSVGLPGSSNRLHGVLKGELQEVSNAVRSVAASYGAVAVARNPVPVEYLAKNAAVGALSLAMDLGETLVKHSSDPAEATHKLAEKLEGQVYEDCVIEGSELSVEGGLDVGSARLRCGERTFEVTYVNEFMTLESEGRRLATFPDLITMLSAETSRPVLSADLKRGLKVHLLVVGRHNIPLGAGVRYRDVYESVERAIGKPIAAFVEDILVG